MLNGLSLLCALYAGMVPALYDDSEKEGLITSIRAELTQQGLPDSREACWAAFVDKVRSNLHVVLAMSPVGDALRSRCRNFPGLVNNTVIDWFEPWPEQVRCWNHRCSRSGSVQSAQSRLFLHILSVVLPDGCRRQLVTVVGFLLSAYRPCKVLPAPSLSMKSCPLSCGLQLWST
jgi:hypothetical protein